MNSFVFTKCVILNEKEVGVALTYFLKFFLISEPLRSIIRW